MSQTAQTSLFPAQQPSVQGPWPLPSGWEWVPLEEAFSIRSGTLEPSRVPEEMFCLYSMPAYDASGNPELCKGREIGSAKILVEPGDILVSKLNPRIPRVWRVTDDKNLRKLASTDFIPLVSKSAPDGRPFFDPTFAVFLLLSKGFRVQVERDVQGATGSRQRLRRENVIASLLPRPRSLDIQRQIVVRIEALLAEIKEARALAAAIRQDTDQIMEAALADTVSELDRHFESLSIGQLVETGRIHIVGGGTPSKANAAYWIGPYPWVSPKDMKRWLIDDAEDHISESALHETSAKLIKLGVVLVVVRGMILAHTWPVAVTTVDVAINQDMKALCPNESLKPEYLGYVLRARAREVLPFVETAAHGTRRLKSETLESIAIPDAPLPAQERLVSSLDAVQAENGEMHRLQAQDAELLDQLEQSILERAFRGEL